MRVFVTGASGVIGMQAVPHMLEAGHVVTAAGRSRERLALLARRGATTVTLNLFDRDALARAIDGHDAVVNLATHVPSTRRAFLPGAWRENDRIRRDGSRLLVEAAQAHGVRRFVQESFAPIYPDSGDAWVTEEVAPQVVAYNRSVLDAEGSAQSFTEAGGDGVVVRFALLYGAGDPFTDDVFRLVRHGWLPFLGRPDAYMSMVNQADAAKAVLAALNVPAGIYNVVDDEPFTRRRFAAALAAMLDVPTPKIPPPWLAKVAGSMGETIARSLRISNRKLRTAGAWLPQYSNVDEGFRAALSSFEHRVAA